MNKHDSVERKVLRCIKEHDMLLPGDKVLVGLSGGKDSVVLLSVLNSLKKDLDIELYAFHLNHMIRGEEAYRDEAFSRMFCEKNQIPFFSERVDVPSLSKKSASGLEATAREVRYSCFDKYSELLGGCKISTAHTLSDNAETVLMSLFRKGTLNEIPPCRDNIIRPLICVTTAEVLQYASDHDLDFVVDSTNLENDYQRNFIRNVILPSLSEKYNGVEEMLSRSGNIFSSYKLLASKLADDYFVNEADPYSISSLRRLALSEAYASVLYAVLSRLFEKEDLVLTGDTFDKLCKMLKNSQSGASVTVLGSKQVALGYEKLLFRSLDEETVEYNIPLGYGENCIPNSPFTVFVESLEEYEKRINKQNRKINKITKNILLDRNIMKEGLYIRSREDGDRFRCRGITRSIKKFLIDEKIDRQLRCRFPIACDSEGIVWVPGIGIADRVKRDAKEVLSLSLEINT